MEVSWVSWRCISVLGVSQVSWVSWGCHECHGGVMSVIGVS